MSGYPEGDTQFEDERIAEVRSVEDGYDIRLADGMGFYVLRQYDDAQPHGVVPHRGDTARMYGRGLGYPVRGMYIGGRRVFYRTASEHAQDLRKQQDARESEKRREFEGKGRAELDAKYDALPEVFRRRLDKFRATKPDFRWQFEDYEMGCCVDAVKLAGVLKTTEAVRAYAALPYEEQKKQVPDLAYDMHSGNSFGFAIRLAMLYLANPEHVVLEHGALTPLVGCEEYGCPHPADASPSGRGGAR